MAAIVSSAVKSKPANAKRFVLKRIVPSIVGKDSAPTFSGWRCLPPRSKIRRRSSQSSWSPVTSRSSLRFSLVPATFPETAKRLLLQRRSADRTLKLSPLASISKLSSSAFSVPKGSHRLLPSNRPRAETLTGRVSEALSWISPLRALSLVGKDANILSIVCCTRAPLKDELELVLSN